MKKIPNNKQKTNKPNQKTSSKQNTPNRTEKTSQGFHHVFFCFIKYLLLVLVIRRHLSLTDSIVRIIKLDGCGLP